MLASGLVGNPSSFVSADVALDSEPVIGSFTVDGLTFAVTEGSDVELVGISPSWQQVVSSQEGDGSPVAPMLASGPDGLDANGPTLALPQSVAYEGVDYVVTSIGAYAFYLSGVTAVELSASIAQVDDRAFRSSDVASVTVADGNPIYSSFDGALYDADQLSLLLIPEGKQGTVLLPKTAESAAPSVFSHCPLVTQVSVEEGSAAFASENGLLYDASLTTLLRVPAGATDIVIRDGCTTIAAGAMEACASLATITAPASVTSVSPDVFTAVPTVSLPAALAVADDPGASTGATEEPSEQAGSIPASGSATTQITAMVALSSTDDDLPKVEPSSASALLSEDADSAPWQAVGVAIRHAAADMVDASLETASSYRASTSRFSCNGGGNTVSPKGDSVGGANADDQGAWGTKQFAVSDNVVSAYASGQTYVFTFNNPGCTWLFWGRSDDASTGINSGTYQNEGEFYAIWDIPITWETNGGYWDGNGSDTAARTSTHSSNSPITGFAGSTSPARVGYRFTGWKSSEDGDLFAAGTNVEVLRKVAYTAQWSPISYTIALDLNGEGATGADDIAAVYDASYALPLPSRPGYVFLGWDTQADGQGTRYQAGDEVSNLTTEAGATVTLYAQWCLSYDLTLPICDPSEITFKVDATTGDVSAVGETADADGVHHDGAISSSMAVPVALSAVSLEALKGADGAYGLSSIFPGDDPLAKARLTLSAGDARASVAFGGSESSVSGFVVPPVQEGGKLAVQYGLELAEGVGSGDIVADTGDAAIAVGRLAYTADVIGGIASEEGFFILDTGQAGRVVGVAEIKRDADALAELAYQGQAALEASELYQRYRRYLEEPDANPTYVKVYDQADGGYSLHRMQVLGICQDTLTTPRTDAAGATIATKAGLTFGWKDVYAYSGYDAEVTSPDSPLATSMNATATNSGGWASSAMRTRLQTVLAARFPDSLTDGAIVEVSKISQVYPTGTQKTQDTIFLLSAWEIAGQVTIATQSFTNAPEGTAGSFQYQYFAAGGTGTPNGMYDKAYRGEEVFCWLRSARNTNNGFMCAHTSGKIGVFSPATCQIGVVPCFAL